MSYEDALRAYQRTQELHRPFGEQCDAISAMWEAQDVAENQLFGFGGSGFMPEFQARQIEFMASAENGPHQYLVDTIPHQWLGRCQGLKWGENENGQRGMVRVDVVSSDLCLLCESHGCPRRLSEYSGEAVARRALVLRSATARQSSAYAAIARHADDRELLRGFWRDLQDARREFRRLHIAPW